MSTLDLFASKIRSTLYKYNNGISQLPLEQLLKECQNELDDLGRQFSNSSTDDGKDKIREIKGKVQDKIKELKQQIENRSGNKKDLNTRKEELEKALNELDVLLNSKMNFKFNNNSFPQFKSDGNTAYIDYDGTEASLLHELKHAFQFETGNIDFIKVIENDFSSKIIPGLTYDLNDEIEAYKRQYAYTGFLEYRIAVNVPLENPITDIETIKRIQSMLMPKKITKMKKIKVTVLVKFADNNFSKPLYESLSRKSLNINSSIQDIKHYNKKNFLVQALGLENEKDSKKSYIKFVKIFIETNPCIYVK